ncbi:hypothetical protein D3C87_1837480 [compost metagenome]
MGEARIIWPNSAIPLAIPPGVSITKMMVSVRGSSMAVVNSFASTSSEVAPDSAVKRLA